MAPSIMISFGTRSEAIKLAPLILYLKEKIPKQVETFVCSTGQHRDLLVPVLKLFDIAPDVDLNVIDRVSDLPSMTVEIVTGVSSVISKVNPTIVLVQGDTASSLGSALAAFYNRVPVCHLEAGLRSYRFYEPFPEELNRRLISQLASYHLTPHEAARSALLREGIDSSTIYVVGNILEDAFAMARARSTSPNLPVNREPGQQMLLVTQHRRENIEHGVYNTCEAIKQILAAASNLAVYFIVYPNPRIRNIVFRLLDGVKHVHLLEPLSYDVFLALLEKVDIVLTDSGAVCEEAAFLGVPTLMLRRATERQYLVDEGFAELIGTSVDMITERTLELLSKTDVYEPKRKAFHLEGGVSRFVAHLLLETILPKARSPGEPMGCQ